MSVPSTHNPLQNIERFLKKGTIWTSLLIVCGFVLFLQFPTLKEIESSQAMDALITISDSVWDQVNFEPGTHLEKKTLRPAIPLLIKVLNIHEEWVIYGIFCCFNILLAAFLLKWLNEEIGDALISIVVCTGLLSVYAGFCGFGDTKGWGDIVPITLLCLTTRIKNPYLLTTCVSIALLSDERSLLALPIIALSWLILEDQDSNERVRLGLTITKGWISRVIAAAIAVLFFLALRGFMNIALGFENKCQGVGINVLRNQKLENMCIGGWSAFEMWWMVVLLLIGWMFYQKQRLISVTLAIYIVITIILSFLVHDITRSIAYLFPIIPVGVVYMFRKSNRKDYCYLFLFIISFGCILAPTQCVYGQIKTFIPLFIRIVTYL